MNIVGWTVMISLGMNAAIRFEFVSDTHLHLEMNTLFCYKKKKENTLFEKKG